MLDNRLWHQALVMDCILELLCGSEQGPNNAMMWTLLHRGIIDMSVVNKPWNRSMQSMRYSVMLVGHLWDLLAGECQGVTPSNSKGGLPAPEARAHTHKREQLRSQASSATNQRGSRDIARVKGRARARRPH